MHQLKVYLKGRKTPIVIESNLAYAIPYWKKQKQLNPNIRIKIITTWKNILAKTPCTF